MFLKSSFSKWSHQTASAQFKMFVNYEGQKKDQKSNLLGNIRNTEF